MRWAAWATQVCTWGRRRGVGVLAAVLVAGVASTLIGTAAEGQSPTEPRKPLVRPLPPREKTDTTVWLGAEVNPRNSPTGFLIEYKLASDGGSEHGKLVPTQVEIVEV